VKRETVDLKVSFKVVHVLGPDTRRRGCPGNERAEEKKRNAYECRIPIRTTADPHEEAPVGSLADGIGFARIARSLR